MIFRCLFLARASARPADTIAALADDDADEGPWRWRGDLSLAKPIRRLDVPIE
jgi:hypothetical protein